MKKHIAVLAGDGIGEEVMPEALRVLDSVSDEFNHQFVITKGYAGGAAYERYGNHLPDETISLCRSADAILFGSVGGPVQEQHVEKWKNCEANSILALRKTFSFFANFRPVRIYSAVQAMSPLKKEVIASGVDLLIVRELLGDCYFGEHKTISDGNRRLAYDHCVYSDEQIALVAHAAYKAARSRRGKLTSVDKANVLDTSRLWRQVVREVGRQYPDVLLEEMLVDNCAMQLVANPSQFDVIVTTNMFGDILSDAAAVLPGSLGLLASASINEEGFGLFEPPGGSAQDIAGSGTANPVGQILSVALMLRIAFGLAAEASSIEQAVEMTLASGLRTRDIYRGEPETTLVNCRQMGAEILARLKATMHALA